MELGAEGFKAIFLSIGHKASQTCGRCDLASVVPGEFLKQLPSLFRFLLSPPPSQDYRDQWAHARACIKRMSCGDCGKKG